MIPAGGEDQGAPSPPDVPTACRFRLFPMVLVVLTVAWAAAGVVGEGRLDCSRARRIPATLGPPFTGVHRPPRRPTKPGHFFRHHQAQHRRQRTPGNQAHLRTSHLPPAPLRSCAGTSEVQLPPGENAAGHVGAVLFLGPSTSPPPLGRVGFGWWARSRGCERAGGVCGTATRKRTAALECQTVGGDGFVWRGRPPRLVSPGFSFSTTPATRGRASASLARRFPPASRLPS